MNSPISNQTQTSHRENVRMTYHSARLAAFALSIVLFAVSGVAHADTVLFTNFGAGMSYDTSGGLSVGNYFDGNNYAHSDQFTVSSTSTLSSLQLALSCLFACPDNFTVDLTSDSSGSPGGVLEAFSVAGSSLQPLGSGTAVVDLTSLLHPTLTAGTEYWVTVFSDTNNTIAWNWNSTGNTNNTAVSTDGGATWFAPSSETPGALQVDGPSTTVIPEPGTFALLGTSLAGLVGFGRRKFNV